MRFVDLFAGLGGFHRALARLDHTCVFASEIDAELRSIYANNFPHMRGRVFGDIKGCHDLIPPHDILCAGFPCQPFSKSGDQLGARDQTRGTLFKEIIKVLRKHKPTYVLLENVGNFERHDGGRTWQIVKAELEKLGYDVTGTEHRTSGGSGLVSPHHLGFPHHRERFFILASFNQLPDLRSLADGGAPAVDRTTLEELLEDEGAISDAERAEVRLSGRQVECIDHWNNFLRALPAETPLPSFPLWGDEIWHSYPATGPAPRHLSLRQLKRHIPVSLRVDRLTRRDLLALLPPYAQRPERVFPTWKRGFIESNRVYWRQVEKYLPPDWIAKLRELPPSLRKLEWNCQGEARDLWRHILQFRPSGLRVKRFVTVPALVAMTTTQVPVVGPRRRFLTRLEGLRLQGFPDAHALPTRRSDAFKALGNAVHVEVATWMAASLLGGRMSDQLATPMQRAAEVN